MRIRLYRLHRFADPRWVRGVAWSILGGSGPLDSGSNPDGPILMGNWGRISASHSLPRNEDNLFVRNRPRSVGSKIALGPRVPRSPRGESESWRPYTSARTRVRRGPSPSPNRGSCAAPQSLPNHDTTQNG